MTCARCNVPFRPNEARREVYIDGATAAGTVIVVHPYACQRAPQQTAPERLWYSRSGARRLRRRG